MTSLVVFRDEAFPEWQVAESHVLACGLRTARSSRKAGILLQSPKLLHDKILFVGLRKRGTPISKPGTCPSQTTQVDTSWQRQAYRRPCPSCTALHRNVARAHHARAPILKPYFCSTTKPPSCDWHSLSLLSGEHLMFWQPRFDGSHEIKRNLTCSVEVPRKGSS